MSSDLSSVATTSFDLFGAVYEGFIEPFVTLADGLSTLLGLIA